MNENIKTVFFVAMMVVVIGGVVVWSGKHDEQVAQASDKYETCIMEQMHMTPSAYYNENGEYPECLK